MSSYYRDTYEHPSGLIGDDEEMALWHLKEAWNRFVKLKHNDQYYPDALHDFRRSIHECQRILAQRIVARNFEGWTPQE